MVSPSFAGKQAVNDDELDQVTAAGQPIILSSGNTSVIVAIPITSIAQTIQTGSQLNLRALALNNVAGENQVANGINISGAGNATALQQSNTITQSWGATSDITIVGVGAATGSLPANCGGALICKVGTQVTTLPGVARRLSRTADVIITAGSTAAVVYVPITNIVASIDGGSQSSLVALVVNNVTGLNQVGNGVNLLAATTTLGVGGIDIGAANATVGGQQTNNLAGYRGTPANFSRIP
jgi:hypothetical protein